MEQQRRMILFFVLSFSAMYLWMNVGIKYFHPDFGEKPPAQQVEVEDGEDTLLSQGDKASATPDAEKNSDSKKSEHTADADDKGKPDAVPANVDELDLKLPKYPRRKVTLGGVGPDSKYFIDVELSSRGAVLTALRLGDKRYPALDNRKMPLQLLGEVPGSSRLSYDMRVELIDQLLSQVDPSLNLETVDWEVVEDSLSTEQVTFRYPSPDGRLEVLKTYQLFEGDPSRKDADSNGYSLDVSLQFRNLTDREIELEYTLQGPVGIPLENVENTRRYLAIQAGFLEDDYVRHEVVSAKEVADQVEDNKVDTFQAPLKYVGVDGQYFAALLVPQEDQEKTNWIAVARPLLLYRHKDPQKSLISIQLESNPITISANQTLSHKYRLYAGPKRDALLRPFEAEDIIEYGWFGSISKIMLAIMMFFHTTLLAPYGVAIILLTVMVRAAMFPISRKHAKAAKKMKEMQPKFEEIKKKHENDKEKLAKAQMELMKESGFFSGCLPMLLQLPIFIGLYQALYTSVDLRMAPFLWIDNLAAPDHLAQLPFTIPFLGDQFNLLPLLTVGLFVVQQKLFAPPAANEEQAMQQKMMSYMMIVIGFMFYRVPAGLCVYFIASSMWAIAERKMLDLKPSKDSSADEPPTATPPAKEKKKVEPKEAGWFQKKLDALDAAANPKKSVEKLQPKPSKKSGKRKKK